MSKPQLVSYEAVSAAAETLVNDGKRASVRSVMAMLGGGSPNAVLVHLNNWKAGRPTVAVSEIQVDTRIAAIISEQISKASAEARSEIEQRLAEVDADSKVIAEAGRIAELELEQAQEQVAALQSQLQQMTGTVEQLRVDAEVIRRDAADQVATAQAAARDAITKAEAVALRERADREVAQMELAKANLRLEGLPKLESEIQRLHAALEDERIGRSAAESEKAAAQAKAAGLSDRLADAQNAAEKAGIVSNERLAEQNRSCAELVSSLKAEIQTLQKQLIEKTEKSEVVEPK